MCSVASIVVVISQRLLSVSVVACREESGLVSNHVSRLATHMAPPLCQLCSLGFLIINKTTDECMNKYELDFVYIYIYIHTQKLLFCLPSMTSLTFPIKQARGKSVL